MERLNIMLAGHHAGFLSKDGQGGLRVTYDEGYRGIPISVGMPTDVCEHVGQAVAYWFRGLLPGSEDVLSAMAAAASCSPRDTYGILARYGMELPGAVQVVPDDRMSELLNRQAWYESITDEEIGTRLDEITSSESRQLPHAWAYRDERWSLSGNQGKLTLYRRQDGRWMSCRGAAASTHILKPGVAWLGRQALVEALCMRAATRVGMSAANVDVASFGGTQAIVIERYDRVRRGDMVIRMHQEDLCQALGWDPDRKYADEGGPNSVQVAEVLRGACPPEDVARFADYLLLNMLMSGTDAHAKNYSLVYPAPGVIRLAPLYDFASNAPYVTSDRNAPYRAAMTVGGENRIGCLRETNVRRCARQFGLNPDHLLARAFELVDTVPAALDEAAGDFSHAEGIDMVASRLVPRIAALCDEQRANLTRPVYGHVCPSYLHVRDEGYRIGTIVAAGRKVQEGTAMKVPTIEDTVSITKNVLRSQGAPHPPSRRCLRHHH